MRFKVGGNFLTYEIQMIGVGAADSVNYAAGSYAGGDAILKGTTTTYPAEPGSATQNGNVITGFGNGAGFSFNGSALAEARNAIEISMNLGVEPVADAINDPYPIYFLPGLRQISIPTIQCIDTDGSVLNALKTAAFTKSTNTATIVLGNVAGSIVTFTLSNLQAGAMSWTDNGAALDVSFGQSDAHATSTAVTDDMTIAFT